MQGSPSTHWPLAHCFQQPTPAGGPRAGKRSDWARGHFSRTKAAWGEALVERGQLFPRAWRWVWKWDIEPKVT